MNVNNIIKGPILTEKSYQLMSQGVYSFKVSPTTNRSETKKAVEYIFNVKVEKVNIFTVPKKEKKLGKSRGFSTKYKKAFVKLKPGYTINLFEDETPAAENLSESNKDQQEFSQQIEEKRAELEQKNQEIAQKLAKKQAAESQKTEENQPENQPEDQTNEQGETN
ncbi:50S ribosomal protein L23 [Mesomycoplasma ovipneumoniae]|uniref:Large ribosomal subunit protein uL23 n=1 Tax=Mesomycoplasma ovipneumoniae 14811 TaxID=1188239 RepID=A0A014KW86_9BACT|nr:50S ribosomal protein L23 [Mesomycoplasma ovipneumoniae]EXU61261.1 50S ribosomal protein L23 [Mesomycoplasma ovipneumoniae 14811]MDW2911429.1 50S ribosomal protein L23 [Mesomycoplasma ovipneumoniae]MDW2913415.1 50S ribosomal protein L23 [Mesomycoplasma ovipneumoniae]MDW2915740.1 50S ribosomal protein L23 [Mesomycoplasma ovipneumoniae]MDW2919409.1 50S ribosomal protein L23 [Mesomycoplasma ovipneumoniae]